jgi:formyl-CoA transferase
LRDRAAAWIATVDRRTAADALAAARVPATPVHDLAEMAADPQVTHRQSLRTLTGATIVRPTPVIDGPDPEPTVPALGEANGEVLGGWLGLDDDELDALRARGVI